MSKTVVDEEFVSLQLDRPGVGKSALQIQKHSIEPGYENKPIERSLYILSKGDDLQKLSVIQNLPNLLKADHNGTVSRIIPKIQQELPVNSSLEFQLISSKIFKILIEMKLDMNLLRPVFQGIESKDPMVANAWNETLLGVITFLTEDAIKIEVLPFTVKQSQLNRPVFYRVNSCKMLGKIAVHPKISAFDVKKDVVPVTQSLCQDCLYEVRAAMCVELPNVAKGLGNEANVKLCLLPCLVELSNDENMQVRAAAVNAAVLLIPYLNAESIKQTAIPLVKRLCLQSFKEGDMTFPHVAKNYGNLLTNLQHHLTDADSVWFVDHYQELSKRGLTIIHEDLESEPLAILCREYCAGNLPDVAFFVLTIIPHETQKWYITFKDLAADPCFIVRKTVAGRMFDITKILGPEGKIILPDLLKLIRDDSEEVLDVLVPNIGSTLALLASVGYLSKEQTTQATLDTGRALLKCQSEIFKYYNWRRNKTFLEQLEKLPLCMPPDFIHQHFTPLILKLTTVARPRPVRTQAARTILFFLRYNMKENHRKWIRESLINSLCNSNCCYTRHIFILMCIEAIQIFSWKYFKEHFFTHLLQLGEDPVSTIRLCVVNLCPTLKQMLIMPIDRNLLTKLENLVSKLEMMEKDKDVLNSLRTKSKEVRTPHVNRPDVLLEEKRKIEEEDKIQQGKTAGSAPPTGPRPRPSHQPPSNIRSDVTRDGSRNNMRGGAKIPTRTSSGARASSVISGSGAPPPLSEMSFLDQHFYIDAGVALPEPAPTGSLKALEDDMSLLNIEHSQPLELIVPTVSVENTNVENMSDDDLIELKTSTTNITDDVKVGIEKKTGVKSKNSGDGVKKRHKRNSCFFIRDIAQTNQSQLKRRSLNIVTGESSRIPVIAKRASKLKKTTIKTDNGDEVVDKMFNKNGSSSDNKLLENVAISSNVKNKCSKEISITKGSNLPVLIS
ncbi:unnamed protein product [Psylliodes chrysocephalus]|uniref:Serine/threonine-protein phosphatase 4 regulatory subunit 4 n=1 Tax=Psylliodes chrysocephalus TaxID=3402493 RepID=A0A9P0GGZ2_9CUCU|nr:unnamed protein product [Psylliodes chrysocephala]